jgi:hypothetical protein
LISPEKHCPAELGFLTQESPSDRPLAGIEISPVLLKEQPILVRLLYWTSPDSGGNHSEAIRDR